jgi:hypothetical protein
MIFAAVAGVVVVAVHCSLLSLILIRIFNGFAV